MKNIKKKIVRSSTPSLNQLQAPNLYSMADRFVLRGKEQDLVTCQLRVSRQLPPKLRRLKQVLATDCCSPSTLNPSVCCTCPVVSQCPVFLRGQEWLRSVWWQRREIKPTTFLLWTGKRNWFGRTKWKISTAEMRETRFGLPAVPSV